MPATPLLREAVPAGALSEIVVNFPDPWPKAEHEGHRLLSADFFRLAAARLMPGGAVLLTTDHDEYFEFACREAQQSGVMRLEVGEAPPAALHTKYALKWQGLGLSAQHARFVSVAQPHAPHSQYAHYPDDPEDPTVPHAILSLPADFEFSAFERSAVRGPAEAYTVVLLDAYRSLRRDEYTVLAHVVEGELTQEVLVNVDPARRRLDAGAARQIRRADHHPRRQGGGGRSQRLAGRPGRRGQASGVLSGKAEGQLPLSSDQIQVY